ncbi:hypothetical protein BS78_08G122600 [Paspalum vaginatum]|nr:hypothetical protein BS78_08G122600 [Paspalum vaginatum]
MMARKGEGEGGDEEDRRRRQHLRAAAARAVAGSLRGAAGAADRAARVQDCVRCLEAEKAKMEVFRRELPISVHLVADVIDWLKEELAQQQQQQRRGVAPAGDGGGLFIPFPPAAEAEAAAKPVKPEEADDKRSWMSSAQLWTCDAAAATATAHDDRRAAANTNGVSKAFMPVAGPLTLARSPGDDVAEKPGAMPVPDLSLSSPAAAPSATSSAVTDAAAGAQQQQQQQRKARRCWSPELHRRFVAALQRLGGAQVATPKQIRELMKVDGLTNDEVKSHLQKYRLHTRRASSDGGEHQALVVWAPEQQYATSQHSTSQSGSPQGPLQLTVSSRAMSATAGDDSCDAGDEVEGGRSESYSWEAQHGAKASSSA